VKIAGTQQEEPMAEFQTMHLPAEPTLVAADGSDVRILLHVDGGGMADFQLAPGRTSTAVRHRTVEEIWYVVAGRGQMWRSQDGREETTELSPGICLTIPLGTSFQCRAADKTALEVIGVTIPRWPGEGEAVPTEGCPDW
jgi:mannose-6-phosphate isomerase-like protein (cupin superfamily)